MELAELGDVLLLHTGCPCTYCPNTGDIRSCYACDVPACPDHRLELPWFYNVMAHICTACTEAWQEAHRGE